MTTKTAIKLLEDLAATFDPGYYAVTRAAIANIIAELEETDHVPVCVSPQEYILKCDWCNKDLGKAAIHGANHEAYCSVPCSVMAADHKKIAELVKWVRSHGVMLQDCCP